MLGQHLAFATCIVKKLVHKTVIPPAAGTLPVQFLHLHHVRDEIKIRGVSGTDVKVSVEKENETAGETNKAHGLWVVPEPRTTSSLILILSQVTVGNRLKHRK